MKRNCKENEKWKQLVKTKTYRALLYVENDASIACMSYTIKFMVMMAIVHTYWASQPMTNSQKFKDHNQPHICETKGMVKFKMKTDKPIIRVVDFLSFWSSIELICESNEWKEKKKLVQIIIPTDWTNRNWLDTENWEQFHTHPLIYFICICNVIWNIYKTHLRRW